MKTFKEAAEELGVTYTTIDRRVNLLGMETGRNTEGRLTVDVDELRRRWEERRAQKVRPRVASEAFLSVTIRQDQRDTLDHLTGNESLAAVVRSLLDTAFAVVDPAREYRESRGWGPVPSPPAS